MGILEKLVEEDFGFTCNGNRWGRAIQHNSLVVDCERQRFYWNSEDLQGNAYIYLTKVRKWTDKTARDYLKNTVKYTDTFVHEIKDGKETVTYPALIDIFHDNLLKGDKEYFYKRTITDETISRYRLGLYGDFYTIPFFQDGVFKQFQLRRDKPEKQIKGYYSGVGSLLFNSDIMKVTNKIVITEAPTSCLVLNQNGIPAVSMNTGAEGFSSEWFPHFIHQKDIYVLFDNDSAGISGARRVAKILGIYRTKIYNFEDFQEKGFDVNDFFIGGGTKKDMIKIINHKTKLIFERS